MISHSYIRTEYFMSSKKSQAQQNYRKFDIPIYPTNISQLPIRYHWALNENALLIAHSYTAVHGFNEKIKRSRTAPVFFGAKLLGIRVKYIFYKSPRGQVNPFGTSEGNIDQQK